ncbi:MAG: hypothetical protein ACRDBG_04475 [Waterburya sp.]
MGEAKRRKRFDPNYGMKSKVKIQIIRNWSRLPLNILGQVNECAIALHQSKIIFDLQSRNKSVFPAILTKDRQSYFILVYVSHDLAKLESTTSLLIENPSIPQLNEKEILSLCQEAYRQLRISSKSVFDDYVYISANYPRLDLASGAKINEDGDR